MIPVANYLFTMFYKPSFRTVLSKDPNNGQGSDTSSQYGDHFCQILVKSDFKLQSYGPETFFAERSCYDLDHQGEHMCEKVLKGDFK